MKKLLLIIIMIVCYSCTTPIGPDTITKEETQKMIKKTKELIEDSKVIKNELDTLSNVLITEIKELKIDSIIKSWKL